MRKEGFSLIEVLIAMAIFAIGVLGLAGLQIRAFRDNQAARLQTEAVHLAEAHLEELAALAYDDPALSPGSYSRSGAGPAGRFHLHWTIRKDTPINGAKTICLRVSWDAGRGHRRAEFTHILSKMAS
ncbi:MAG TPA: prepilin-type N-terminal cleavage/methylation domain-containing protein [Desulfosalsimonadaceae bacterium]|nr:prepilin-type N-terminal cleavage/methylation domain-containing protein [Desulfosalsimonadaceae bacterium]